MTKNLVKNGWVIGLLGIGMAIGAFRGGGHSEVRFVEATGADRIGDFALTTGYVEEGVEAVYYLDYLTGRLVAGVLSKQTRAFQGMYWANLNEDLRSVVDAKGLAFPKKPSYLIVTGVNDIIRTGGGASGQPGLATLYVAETNTGILLAYVVPWNSSAHMSGQAVQAPLMLWTAQQFGAFHAPSTESE